MLFPVTAFQWRHFCFAIGAALASVFGVAIERIFERLKVSPPFKVSLSCLAEPFMQTVSP